MLAIRRNDYVKRTHLQDDLLQRGDILLVAGLEEHLEQLEDTNGFDQFRYVDRSELTKVYHLHEQLMVMQVAPGSVLISKTLKEQLEHENNTES